MIYGRLRRLGYKSLERGDFESFTRFREERDRADGEVLAILEEIGCQVGEAPHYPKQDETGGEPVALGEPAEILDLMRIAAHLEDGALPPEPRTTTDPSADPVLSPYLLRNKDPKRFTQLLGHAESSGYYVPLEFPKPFFLVDTSRSVGSSQGLLQELAKLNELLDPRASEFPRETEVLKRLLPLARESVRTLLAIELEPETGE